MDLPEARVPAPRHSPPDRDCRTWAFALSPDPNDPQSHGQLDKEVEAAWSAASTWLDTSDRAIGDGPGLTSLFLPHPAPGRAPFETGLVDADLLHAIVAATQKAGEEVDGLYVGLVAQEPSARWIGLAGFFLPVCPQCDPRGVGRATDRVLDLLGTTGFEEIPGSVIPEGLRPSPGWFDRERLQTVVRRPTAPRRTTWFPWPPAAQDNRSTGILVRVGPTITSLSGLVLCGSVQDALGLPELLGMPATGWTWTAGDTGALVLATNHQPRRPREVRSRMDGFHDWWTSDKPLAKEVSRRLHRGHLPRQAPKADQPVRLRIWALDGNGVVTREELEALLHTPA